MTTPFVSGRTYTAKLKALLQRSATTSTMTATHWDTLAQEYGPEVYSEALYRLTRLEMNAEQARQCLLAIVEHQQKLNKKLGRSVSLLTATCDYFMQVNPVVREPILVEVRLLQQKEENAYRDELTGLFNRRSFNQEMPREMERFRRFGQPFTLLMLDLDNFKNFNDTFGHSAGDQALRDVGRILVDSARLYDRVVRYGGEEFALILPQASNDEALSVAERIRESMAQHHVFFSGQDLGIITVSIGLASYPKDGLNLEGLVQSADQAMYQAKVKRNDVQRFHDSQRDHPRYILSDPLPLSLQSPQLGRLQADARDISFGGILCSSTTPLQPTTVLNLVLSDTLRNVHLSLQAEVRRLDVAEDNTYQMGLAFRLDSVEEQMKLMALVDGRVFAAPAPRRDTTQRLWA